MKLSRRSAVDDLPSQLATAIEALSADRPRGVDLTLSNPTRAGLTYEAYAGMHFGALTPRPRASSTPLPELEAYAPDPLGLESARRAVAHHWPGGRRPSPEHMLLLPSSSDAYHYLFTLLCDEGDAVLVPEPSYPLLGHLAKYAGVQVQRYRLAYDGAWHIDLESVRRARTERTRAIVLVNPNNPTGSYTTAEELEALASSGLALISDEVFARYPLRATAPFLPTALHATRALTFCIDGLSKSAGLPQAKLSWVAASGEAVLVGECMERLAWMADTYLSVGSPVQRALPDLLERSATFRATLLERLVENRAALIDVLCGSAASVLHAEGGWYAVVRLPDVASEEDWVLGLLEHGVLTHPGHFYDFEGDRPHLVLSLIVSASDLRKGAEAIRREVIRRCPASTQ